MKTINLNYNENMDLHVNNPYETPRVEVIEVAVEKGFATTGIGGSASDSDDSEFSAPAQRRGTWGNLWSE